ncbi:MAG TPA: hypothetical protein VFW07_04800 [Parafilimonas sp.]|nr:hypothetical protein [Parafilimonas sp.]
MRDRVKNLPVNWIDGMKINKSHFIAQDDAWRDALNDVASLNVSHIKFGILSPSSAGEDNFNVKISIDNQNTLKATVLACQAVTPGGIRINLPSTGNLENISGDADALPSTIFRFSEASTENIWWIVLIIHPFQKKAVGSPDLSENPPRYPYLLPGFSVEVVSESQYNQFAYNPYALTIGKVLSGGNDIRVDNNYIPPCYSTDAFDDLRSLHAELDSFLATLEIRCTQIVQKIYKKNQQNEISELVQFLCDRLIIFLSENITQMRWITLYDSPASLFAGITGLARLMKNVIDLRIGSGKEEMINYLSEWCELRQGELETMLTGLANIRYNHNDVNSNIQKITQFIKVTSTLFETLSKLEFIGKKKDSGIFVKEEPQGFSESQQNKARRRFFG